MTKKIFIRYDTSEGYSWSDCLETTNTEVAGVDSSTIKDFDQPVHYYYKSDNKIRIFKTDNDNTNLPYLSIGLPVGVRNQSFAINYIDFNLITSTLEKSKFDAIHFAYHHKEGEDPRISAKRLDIMETSSYYARNKKSKKMQNVVTGEDITSPEVIMSVWFTVFKLGDTDTYYLVVNPNLVSITNDLTGSTKTEHYYLINAHDGNLKTAVFKPSFSGCKQIGDNILYTDGDTIGIDVLGNSFLHGFSGGKKMPYAELPFLESVIDSSFEYTREQNTLTFNVDKNVGYIKYNLKTNTPLDYFLSGAEKLEYSFVVIKE